MKKITVLLLLALIGCGIPQSDFDALKKENSRLKVRVAEFQKHENKPEVTLPNTTVREITSKHNGQTYQIKVKFPKGYKNENKKYPVLYVLDAETNFGGVSYIVQRLTKDKLIPKVLVVGIAYGTNYDDFYKLRSRDLTPVEDRGLKMGGTIHPTGGAQKFSDFLEKELFPFIETNYSADKNNRTLYGHSYGGLYGCHVFLHKPEMFNKYLLLSPSLWYADNLLLEQVNHIDFNLHPTKLYMASGELEGRIDNLQTLFVNRIKQLKPSNLSIKTEVKENETHRTIFGTGLTNGLRFLFSETKG